jgi:hypothetical protein
MTQSANSVGAASSHVGVRDQRCEQDQRRICIGLPSWKSETIPRFIQPITSRFAGEFNSAGNSYFGWSSGAPAVKSAVVDRAGVESGRFRFRLGCDSEVFADRRHRREKMGSTYLLAWT